MFRHRNAILRQYTRTKEYTTNTAVCWTCFPLLQLTPVDGTPVPKGVQVRYLSRIVFFNSILLHFIECIRWLT